MNNQATAEEYNNLALKIKPYSKPALSNKKFFKELKESEKNKKNVTNTS